MPIRCNLKIIIARENVRRIEHNQSSVSMRSLAKGTGLALSSLTLLAANKSQRIDYNTIDALCGYFNIDVGDLLERVPAAPEAIKPPAAETQRVELAEPAPLRASALHTSVIVSPARGEMVRIEDSELISVEAQLKTGNVVSVAAGTFECQTEAEKQTLVDAMARRRRSITGDKRRARRA